MAVYFKGNGQGLLDSLFIPAREAGQTIQRAGINPAPTSDNEYLHRLIIQSSILQLLPGHNTS